MKDNEKEFNYLTKENNVTVTHCSSSVKNCPINNILLKDRKKIWVSESNPPQTIVFNLTNMTQRPKFIYKYFGIYCWHAFSTNPKTIEIFIAQVNNSYISMGIFEVGLQPGRQFFIFDKSRFQSCPKVNFLKIVIKETFGGSNTYLNQVFLFDESVNLTRTEKVFEDKSMSRHINNEGQSFFNSYNFKDDDEEEDESYEPIEPMKQVYNLKKINNDMFDLSGRSKEDMIKQQFINMDKDDEEEEENDINVYNNEMDVNEQVDEKMKKIKKVETILKAKTKPQKAKVVNKKETKVQNDKNTQKMNRNKKKKTYEDVIMESKQLLCNDDNNQDDSNDNIEQYLSQNNDDNNKRTVTPQKEESRNATISYALKRPQISSRLAERGKTINFNNNEMNSNFTDVTLKERIRTPNTTSSHILSYSKIPKRTLTPLKQVSRQLYKINDEQENSKQDPDYEKLEQQINDMEEQIKSMNPDGIIESVVPSNLIHSKSLNCIRQDNYPETIGILSPNNKQHIKIDNNEIIDYAPLQSNQRKEFKTIIQNNESQNNSGRILDSNNNCGTFPLSTTNPTRLNNNTNFNSRILTPNSNYMIEDTQKSKIQTLENKIGNVEQEIKEMKQNFELFKQEFRTFMTQNNMNTNPSLTGSKQCTPNKDVDTNQNIINTNEQILQVLLKECASLINQKFLEIQQQQMQQQAQAYQNYQNNNNNNVFQYSTGNNNISTDSNIISFEARMNKKIEERFKLLTKTIENQILLDFVQPSMQQMENKMKKGMDEIKEKISNLNFNRNINNFNSNSNPFNTKTNEDRSENISFVDSYRCSRSIQSSVAGDLKSSEQRRNDKFEELSGKLYEKLLEKEKKLMELKNEKNIYMQNKHKNEEKRLMQEHNKNVNK